MICHRINDHGVVETYSDASEREKRAMSRRAATDRHEDPERVAAAIAKVRADLGIMGRHKPRPSAAKPKPAAKPRRLPSERQATLAAFGPWLKQQMTAQGMTCRALVETTGYPYVTIKHYRNGYMAPSRDRCIVLATALGVDPGEVLRRAGHTGEAGK